MPLTASWFVPNPDSVALCRLALAATSALREWDRILDFVSNAPAVPRCWLLTQPPDAMRPSAHLLEGGVSQDKSAAKRLLRPATERGNAFVQISLDTMHGGARGVPEDDEQTVR